MFKCALFYINVTKKHIKLGGLTQMKQWFVKLKNNIKNATRGFSLVELIVVIAIMAVMAAVLAPALLGYVERSRAQKDDSAMDEMVNSVQLALADTDVYDELLTHSVYDNVSCYIDSESEFAHAANKIVLKEAYNDKKEQYMFDDTARQLDEIDYWAAGNMRGITITFSPDKESNGDTYDLEDGLINKFVGRKMGKLSDSPELYNRVRATIGDTLETTSQTYRNSDYTLFIQLGSTGGAEAVAQDAIKVWGQFSGTNLDSNPNSFKLATNRVVGEAGSKDEQFNQNQNINTEANHNSNIIPAGARYERGETVYEAGQEFPSDLKVNDRYYFAEYVYIYKPQYFGPILNGWSVSVVNEFKGQESYSDPLATIRNEPLVKVRQTYRNNENLKYAPKLPNTVIELTQAFENCPSLISTPELPNSIQMIDLSFHNCKSLKSVPNIPTNVNNVGMAFASSGLTSLPDMSDCTQLTSITTMFYDCDQLIDISNFKFSSTVTDLSGTFKNCNNINKVFVIPSQVNDIDSVFAYCNQLSNDITINSTNLTDYQYAIVGTKINQINGTISNDLKTAILATK